MKPDFALDFRDDHITLLQRQEGGWAHIGRVAMDDPDLDSAMGYLRATAMGLSPRGIAAKLILPNDAILYTNLPDLPLDAAQRAAQIAQDLQGRTPYAVDDLVWDWTDDGASANVAVIARETLAEAEAFATQHRFNPMSFCAIPNAGGFAGEVWFGATSLSQTLLASGETVEKDTLFAYVANANTVPQDIAPLADHDAAQPAPMASDFEMGAEADDILARDADLSNDPADAPVRTADDDSDLTDPPADAPIQDAPVDAPEDDNDTAPFAASVLASDEPPAPVADETLSTAQMAIVDAAQPIAPPANFDAAMSELDSPEDSLAAAQDNSPDEAPMALDVPLLDAAEGEDQQTLDLADHDRAAMNGTPNAVSPAIAPPPQTKAEKMLAAFAARRAAALAKSEASTNNTRIEPRLSAALTAPRPEAGASDNAQAALDTAVNRISPASLPPPSLGSAAAIIGKPAEQSALLAPVSSQLSGLRPAEIKHIPAKDTPPRPQNLKSMPKTKSARRGIGLGWILTAALLIALAAGAAVSSYMLESFNALFTKDSALASVEAPAQSPQTPAAAAPISITASATPPAAIVPPDKVASAGLTDQAAMPARADGTVDPSSRLERPVFALPALPKLPQLPDAALAAAQISPANIPAQSQPPSAIETATQTLPDTAQPAPAATAAEVFVTAAPPPIVPSARPDDISAARAPAAETGTTGADTAPDITNAPFAANAALPGLRPLPRPAQIAPQQTAQAEQPAPAILSDPALARLRPLARAEDILAAGRAARLASAPASLVASVEIDAAERALTEGAAPAAPEVSPLAIAVSLVPAARPRGLRAAFDAARDAEIVAAAAASAAAVAPSAAEPAPEPAPRQTAANSRTPPDIEEETEEVVTNSGGASSRSVVARQATLRNAINLRSVNLVGIFGSNANRYALIRQPAGTFRRLKVGDRFDGGQIAAITESEVRYAKGGQMLALRMPNS